MTMQSTPARDTVASVRWGTPQLEVDFAWSTESPVTLNAVILEGRRIVIHPLPCVEIITVAAGHVPASSRLAHSAIGAELRYASHREWTDGEVNHLEIRQTLADLETVILLSRHQRAAAIRSQVRVRNTGVDRIVLRSVASLAAGFTAADTEDDSLAGWSLISGKSDWLGEGRWSETPVRGGDFPVLAEHLTGHDPRGSFAVTSDGTWSTGHNLPVAGVANDSFGLAFAWQIEHNGAWRWEIAEDSAGGYFALSGPTDSDAAWTQPLNSGEEFATVPATVAIASSWNSAIRALTDYRRAVRRPHVDNLAMPVVFNDYMNTLNGDPTTEKLLPLIAAAADIGAEVFCIDAGWYDDSGHWWDSVGEWLPSMTRFPGGLGEVIDAIRGAGMIPGLWLEPEVVGVRSPVASRLPESAFLQRHGVRIVEHDRFHLDLRHPAAVAHLDEVVDRLVRDFGIGFFKFDYNINPGSGTDFEAPSVGAGLLAHNRAHLAWLDSVLDRHADLIIESCSSGAMRMDAAILSRLQMQSTSDQQDFRKYPPIAASAPMSMVPEQAASWAYPQPDMTSEEVAFCLVTGLLGRFYVSGHLNQMSDGQRSLVADAVSAAKDLRPFIVTAQPNWPLGLPTWDDDWVALALSGDGVELVSVWRRAGSTSALLTFPHLVGRDVSVATEFPRNLPAWQTEWDASTGTLHVHAGASIAARTLRLVVRPARAA